MPPSQDALNDSHNAAASNNNNGETSNTDMTTATTAHDILTTTQASAGSTEAERIDSPLDRKTMSDNIINNDQGMTDPPPPEPETVPPTTQKVPLIELNLENVTYSPLTKTATRNKGGGPTAAPNHRTTVLHHISTKILPFKVTAWMGPSGSGKTSLLTVAANLTGADSEALSPDSTIWVNGQQGRIPKRLVGVVWQDDLLLSNLTVRENVWYAARLKTPMSVSDAQVEQTIEATLENLGLTKVQHSLVGNHMRRGISGGERKRVAVASELVVRPSLLFLDEPTSGLDAATALELMQTLQDLARGQGLSIVTVIHQPRTSIFNQYIDSLLLLSRGRVVYNGPPRQVRSYLETCCGGTVTPLLPETGIADWIMDVIKQDEQKQPKKQQQQDTDKHAENLPQCLADYWDRFSEKAKKQLVESEQFDEEEETNDESKAISVFSDDRQQSSLSLRQRPMARNLSTLEELASMPKYDLSSWLQFRLLAQRTLKQQRGERLTAVAAILQLVYLFFTALFWWRLSDNTSYIFERNSLFFFILISQSNGVVVSAVTVFATERALLRRERAKKMYGVASYFLAKTVSDMTNNILLPLLYTMVVYWTANLRLTTEAYFKYILSYYLIISTAQAMGLALSVAIPQVQMALVLAPPLTLFFMVMGGFYLPFDSMNPVVEWVSYLSFCRYGYSALLINEYAGRDISCDDDGGEDPLGTDCPLPGDDVISSAGIKGATESYWFNIGMMIILQVVFRFAAYWMLSRSK
ncbi:hypothetical protein ACA910_009744 [Epithemia clementina (nom. ined.)]